MTVTQITKDWITIRCGDEIEIVRSLEFFKIDRCQIVYDSVAKEYVVIARRRLV